MKTVGSERLIWSENDKIIIWNSVDVAVREYFVSCTFNQHQMEFEAEVPSSPKRRASYALPPSQELRHLQLYVDRMSMVVPFCLS
jgi:hypothetical protein